MIPTIKLLLILKDSSAMGESVIGSMGSLKELPFNLKDLYFIPAQVNENTTKCGGAC